MKRIILFCCLALLLCSCAGINVKKPDIGNVKKIAILAVTGNEEFIDIEEFKEKKETLMSFVGGIIKDNVEYFTEEQVTIVTHGANELHKALSSIDGWTVVPFEETLNSEDVKAFFASDAIQKTAEAIENAENHLHMDKIHNAKKPRYVTPTGMMPLPYNYIVPSGHYYVNNTKVEDFILKPVGELCEKLDVDAIAIADFQFAYEKGMMTKLMNRVTPIVRVDVALVDKSGNMILYSDRGWDQFEGDDYARYSNGGVDMKASGTVDVYRATVNKAVEGFKKKAAAKIGK